MLFEALHTSFIALLLISPTMQTAMSGQFLCSSRSSAVLPSISQHYSICLSHSLSCKGHSHGQNRQLHKSTTAAVPHPQQQPAWADVRAASSSSSSSSSSSGSSSVTSSGSFSSGSALPTAFKKHGITGDGSCMFRACVQGDYVAQHGSCMSTSQEYSKVMQLRKDVVQELANSREEMEPFLPGIADDFDGYLQMMSKPGVWGGEPELLMASRVLKRPICVYQSSWTGPQHIVTYGEDMLHTTQPMHLLWSGAHYDLLLPQIKSRL